MNKKLITFLLLAITLGIGLGFFINKPQFSWLFVLPIGFMLVSLVFFSRGILIFLTALTLSACGFSLGGISTLALQFRWVLFGVFMLHIFGDIFLGRTVRSVKFFDIMAILFICYAYLSMLYSPFPKLTLERATTILVLYFSVFWFIWKYAYEQGPEKVVYVIIRLMWILFAMSFMMIFIFPERAFYVGRFTGIFGNPNGLGVTAALMLPISLWYFLTTKKRSALFLFIMIAVGLLLCGARGSMNATAFALGYFVYAYTKKNKAIVFFILTTVILIFGWIIETVGKELFRSYMRVDSLSILGGRLEAWTMALGLIMSKPIFGYGFGVEDKIFSLKKVIFIHHAGAYVHNSYLGIFLQLGIVGFTIFFVPLFILLFSELYIKEESLDVPLLRYALRASLIAGLICCVYESWVYSAGNTVAFPFWIMVMLLVFYSYQDKTIGLNSAPVISGADDVT